jgi:hypothetical protein
MGRSQDLLPSQQGWLHELAKAEIYPDAEGVLQLDKGFDPQQLVEESTIDFLTELRDRFNENVRLFNSYSENNTRFQEIKIYSIAQTPADFMLFRNQVKLIIANSAHGIIQIGFSQHVRGTMAVDGQSQAVTSPVSSQLSIQPHELLAQLGPFRDVGWSFQGEKVSPEQVSKFYFAEFAKVTRDLKRLRSGNQLLIEQIKALLQQKGLDL